MPLISCSAEILRHIFFKNSAGCGKMWALLIGINTIYCCHRMCVCVRRYRNELCGHGNRSSNWPPQSRERLLHCRSINSETRSVLWRQSESDSSNCQPVWQRYYDRHLQTSSHGLFLLRLVLHCHVSLTTKCYLYSFFSTAAFICRLDCLHSTWTSSSNCLYESIYST